MNEKKKLERLTLRQLSNRDLNEFEMGILWGGSCNCACGCLYEGQPGGSSTGANKSTNNAGDLYSPGYGDGGGSDTNYSYEEKDCSFWVNCVYSPNPSPCSP